MNSSSATLVLAAHLAVLSSISFGGFPTVLPDVHDFAVAKGWVSDHEFANFFRDTPWQRIVRRGLAPLRLGLSLPAAILWLVLPLSGGRVQRSLLLQWH